jgi:hypothetical protein
MAIEIQSFEELVDDWVLGAVKQGIETFDKLLLALPSVYPSVALSSIQRLVASEKLNPNILINATEGIRQGREKGSNLINDYEFKRISLPVPHPLDYDWRYGISTSKHLLDLCLDYTQPEDLIILLGTPSLLSVAVECSYPRQMVLLDSNSAIIDSFAGAVPEGQVRRFDAFQDTLPELEAAVVIIDPPWYERHLMAFTWVASRLCKKGGHILASVPPIGTRPNVQHELSKYFQWTEQLRLTRLSLELAALPYISPPYERNALRAEGLFNVPMDWRRGDLAIFLNSYQNNIPRPVISSPDDSKWVEESLFSVRVRIRNDLSVGFSDPTLRSIVSGDILPSVSRRDERRTLVDVWTSGNRVFTCKGRGILRQIISALAIGRVPEDIVAEGLGRKLTVSENELVLQATSQIMKIIELEQTENALIGGDPKTC